MKKTISTLFTALMIAGATSVNAQDTKVKTKKVATATATATATAKEIKPANSTSGVVAKKINKIDPTNPPADATNTKATTTAKAKKITKAKAKTAVAQPIVEPKKTKANTPK